MSHCTQGETTTQTRRKHTHTHTPHSPHKSGVEHKLACWRPLIAKGISREWLSILQHQVSFAWLYRYMHWVYKMSFSFSPHGMFCQRPVNGASALWSNTYENDYVVKGTSPLNTSFVQLGFCFKVLPSIYIQFLNWACSWWVMWWLHTMSKSVRSCCLRNKTNKAVGSLSPAMTLQPFLLTTTEASQTVY